MNDTIKDFLKRNYSADNIQFRINIFNEIRDYVYQINDANTPEKLLACKEGYCVSKHRLLKSIYEELGYRSELCFIPFTFDMAYLPNHIKDWGLAKKKGYHTFLKLWIDGKSIDIDATFNKELRNFYVVNESWDGTSSQNMICEIKEIYIPKNQEEEYEINKKLSDSEGFTDTDKKWVEEYNIWIKNIGKGSIC